MIKQRVYIDTSVIGGYFDDEFSADTIHLFERIINGDFTIYLSEISRLELLPAPVYVQEDVLLSWNFRHIVNWDKIRLFNSVNLKNGYPSIEIRSPKELLKYED